jgi:hypothetical protein
VALPAVAVLLVLSGCGSDSSSDASKSSPAGGAVQQQNAVGQAGDAAEKLAASGGSAGAGQDPNAASIASNPSPSEPPLTGLALIKTAAISLQSDSIPAVLRKLDEVAAKAGGAISSEDTQSNTNGAEIRTRVVLSVPAASFDRTVNRVSTLGDLISRARSTQDVTSRVVDVASRVTSAEDSIAQLRTLFHRATKLREVIDLERELSTREANLEALQSEQRSLASRTSMSTLTVNVSRPPKSAATHHDEAQSGFISGIQQGWHGLVVFVVGFSHGLGLVLPLGILALLAALVIYVVIRRFMPRREAHMSE